VQPDACTGTVFKLSMPTHEPGKRRKKRYRTAACGLHARVAVKYDPTTPIDFETDTEVTDSENHKSMRHDRIAHPGEKDQGLAVAPVCAVDDAVGLWPRFEHLMSDNSYQPE
jgi:hypothetical protein